MIITLVIAFAVLAIEAPNDNYLYRIEESALNYVFDDYYDEKPYPHNRQDEYILQDHSYMNDYTDMNTSDENTQQYPRSDYVINFYNDIDDGYRYIDPFGYINIEPHGGGPGVIYREIYVNDNVIGPGVNINYDLINDTHEPILIPFFAGHSLFFWEGTTVIDFYGFLLPTQIPHTSKTVMRTAYRENSLAEQYSAIISLRDMDLFGSLFDGQGGTLRAYFLSVQTELIDLDLNNDSNGNSNNNGRAVVGYLPQDFIEDASVRNLRLDMGSPGQGIMDRRPSIAPLLLEILPSTQTNNVDFHFADLVSLSTAYYEAYEFETGFIHGNSTYGEIAIAPNPFLPAGRYSTEVQLSQQGYCLDGLPVRFLLETHPNIVHPQPGSFNRVDREYADPNDFYEHRGRFTLEFLIERPVTQISIGNKSNQEVDATLTVRDVWPSSPGAVTEGIVTGPQADINHGITYVYTNPGNPATSNIIVTLQPPTYYTFFDGPGYSYKDIIITPPPGYEEHSRSLDGSNLIVEFRPLQSQFPISFIKLDRNEEPLPGAEFRLYRQDTENPANWTHITTQFSSDPEGRVSFTLTRYGAYRIDEVNAPGGYETPPGHWNIIRCPVTRVVENIVRSDSDAPNFEWRPLVTPSGLGGSIQYHGYYGGNIGHAPAYKSYDSYSSYQLGHAYQYSNFLERDYYIGYAPHYAPFVPFGSEVEHATITHPNQLLSAINGAGGFGAIPANGVPHIIRLDFSASGNVVTTTDLATIVIPNGNRHIILDSASTNNQVWHRNQVWAGDTWGPDSRHIAVGDGAMLELRDITIGRCPVWVENNSTAVSGGIHVNDGGGLRLAHSRATISNNLFRTTSNFRGGGGVYIGNRASFNMTAGNIVDNVMLNNAPNRRATGGGGIFADGDGQQSTVSITGGRISGNRSEDGYGGGIGLCCNVAITIGGNARIYDNVASRGGGGINMGGFGGRGNFLTINGGCIHSNHAVAYDGGGIRGGIYNSTIAITGGNISRNIAARHGGGIYLPESRGSFQVAMLGTSGNIAFNQASHGGGIFVHHNNAAAISPAFLIGAGSIFRQNIATGGMRVNHVMNTISTTVIPGTVSVYRTGHAFTNHDINSNGPEYAWHVANKPESAIPDWIRLYHQVNFTGEGTPPSEIVIHPRGGTGTITQDTRAGGIFHLVITDPDPVPIAGGTLANPGQWITTVPITGAPSGNYPHGHHPHRIPVIRPVRISAVAGANITLLMAVPQNATAETAVFRTGIHMLGGSNNDYTFLIPATANNLGRHFIVNTDGNLQLGAATGSVGTGAISVHGNSPGTHVPSPDRPPAGSPTGIYGADIFNRGGINIAGGGQMHLQQGGAIRNNRRADTGGTLNDDSGFGGGGVAVRHGSFYMYAGSEIFYNTARIHGGGVFAARPTHTVAGAPAPLPNMYSNVTIYGGVIRNNFAVPSWLVQPPTVQQPITAQGVQGDATGGGGIHIRMGGSLTMHDGEIHNNRAHRGGGVRIHGPSGSPSSFTMNGGEIHNNYARADTVGFAGGSSGGGVLVEGGTTASPSNFFMNGGRVHNNESQHSGGGVYLRSNAHFRMRNETIVELNQAVGNHGGGVWLDSGATLLMCNDGYGTTGTGIVRRNRGNNGGAGLHLTNGARFVIEYGEIYNNLVTGTNLFYGAGGGIRINATAPANGVTSGVMHDGRISGNRGLNAGGVWVGSNTAGFGAQFTMHGGVIEGNWTSSHTGFNVALPYGGGGGVLVHGHNAVFTMNGGAIRDNISALDGGGVLLTPSNTVASIDGTPAGTNRMNGGTFNFNGGIIEGNRAANGGGIFSRRGVINMQNNANNASNNTGRIHNNTAGIASRMAGSSLDINNINYTTTVTGGNGGGVYIINANAPERVFTMEGGTITSNRATNNGDGGGVFLTGADASFNMYRGTIGGALGCPTGCDECAPGGCDPGYGNRARSGAGIYLDSGTTFNLRTGLAKIITGNIAAVDGGGVWVAQTGEMRMQTALPAASGLQVTNNRASGMGGGIFTAANGEYPDPLVTVPAFPAAGLANHFRNLILAADTRFSGNMASSMAVPPINVRGTYDPAVTLPDLQWDTNFLSPPADHLGSQHPLNNFDINFMNEQIIFEFIKTNNVVNPHQGTQRLAGAVFQLYWRPNDATAWAIAGTQVRSEADGVVEFVLSGAGEYRLVEVIPPPNFAPVFGYWLLETTTTAGVTTVTAVHSRGGNPAFGQGLYDGDLWWWVGNAPGLVLPLTGGVGLSHMFIAAGTILLAAAMIAVVAQKMRKNREVAVSYVKDGKVKYFTRL